VELTPSFVELLQDFAPVFTAPTFQTFVTIVGGWLFTRSHRYITEIIAASGKVGCGHWCRFHRFFSHAAWELDPLAMVLAKLVVTILASGAQTYWAVDDTLCRKRGLTLYGAGMHYDPLISSRAKPLVSWGHDWVVLCLILVHPFWAPTKVFALPVAVRLYRNHQGLTKGKKKSAKAKKPKRDHRTRPELARELIALVAGWFPDDQIVITGDSAYSGQSILKLLPPNVHLISHVHPKGALYEPVPPRTARAQKGAPRKKGARLPSMAKWAEDPKAPWTTLRFDQFGLHATLAVKTMPALYYKAGGDRLLTIVLVRDLKGGRPDQMFYCTKLEWNARQVLTAYSYRWAIECTFRDSKQFLGLEDPANRLARAVGRTAPTALFLYSLVVVWFHRMGHAKVRFPERPWYRNKREPSFADMLATLRRVSLEEKTATQPPQEGVTKTWIAQLIDSLSRAA
jgi:hypothetical protein